MRGGVIIDARRHERGARRGAVQRFPFSTFRFAGDEAYRAARRLPLELRKD